ncbi:hypothetical protein AMTRI_Chr08g165160 [Amborella trichopoda]
MKMIESKTNRQVTYSKRKNDIIKKAYELSVLCDVDNVIQKWKAQCLLWGQVVKKLILYSLFFFSLFG